MSDAAASRPRNDVRQYDDLVGWWWDPGGPFAMLHWIADARGALIPPAGRPGAVLVDLGCGGGLLAPVAARLGYRHLGVDLSGSALGVAKDRGVHTVLGDVARLPLSDEVADVVVAGEILEHVTDLGGAVDEACRVLRPNGTVILDTIARTALARLIAVRIAERLPGGAPRGIHDPNLFVDRDELRRLFARNGVRLTLRGLRPSLPGMVRWLVSRRGEVRMIQTRSTSVLFQGYGVKEAP